MLKRTKGRFLLTMLVITGLAGTFKDSSLTSQERKVAVTTLKDTKNDLLKSIKGLSDAQLNFKSAPDSWSINDCVSHITLAEKKLWEMLNITMKEQATPEGRSHIRISDESLVRATEKRVNELKTNEFLQPNKAPWRSASEALNAFKASRMDHIKYAKSTTEDLRDHFVHLPSGSLDGYQFILFVSAHCNEHIRQINEIKANPAFPKQ